VPFTVETHERAIQIAERYGYSIFDSLIIAAALHVGASTLTQRTCEMARRSTALQFAIHFRARQGGSRRPVRESSRCLAQRLTTSFP
jgi:hypothetical protein